MQRRARILVAGSLVVASGALSQDTATVAAFGAPEWRTWFLERRFGEDPYFFVSVVGDEAGPCPPRLRLTLAGSDSAGIRLVADADQTRASSAPVSCEIRFDRLRGRPEQAELEPGRRLWRLQVAGERPRQSTPTPSGKEID